MYKDFKPFVFYGVLALILAIIGLAIGIPVIVEFVKTHYITKIPSAVLATGIMLFSFIMFQSALVLDTVVKQNREKYEIDLLRYREIERLKENK